MIWVKTERRFYQITVVIEQLFVNLGTAHDQTRIDVNLWFDVYWQSTQKVVPWWMDSTREWLNESE